jgi:hypothetical protein
MSVRADIVKALTRSQKTANVVPFGKPGAKPKPKKRVKKPKVYKRIIEDGDGGYVSPQGRDRFTKETIDGKPHLRREDGALFKLRRDGQWVLVQGGSAGRRKKGNALPYAVGAGLGGAAAAGIYASQDDD